MEKKNYCVDGKCTCFRFRDCTQFSQSMYGLYACAHYDAETDGCESQKSSDKYASIRQLTPKDRDEILEFALKRSAEILVEE